MATEDYRIHVRYHDAIDALIGTHHYRYEVHRRSDLTELVKSLVPKGMDEFAFRRLNSLDTWEMINATDLIMTNRLSRCAWWPDDTDLFNN